MTTDLTERLEAVAELVRIGRGRDGFDTGLLAETDTVLRRAAERLRLSAGHTVVAIAGGTGSGKSTLFNALSGATFSPSGVTRPTTRDAHACVWGMDGADPLLNWLGVDRRRRHARASALDSGEAELQGLILLDLPDHDSVVASSVAVTDRIATLADMLIWVLDPQKYADAAVHNGYLIPLAGHAGVLTVVLSQADLLTEQERADCEEDLRRLLDSEGLESARLHTVSARAGEGLDELRALLAETVGENRAAAERISADLDSLIGRYETYVNGGGPGGSGSFGGSGGSGGSGLASAGSPVGPDGLGVTGGLNGTGVLAGVGGQAPATASAGARAPWARRPQRPPRSRPKPLAAQTLQTSQPPGAQGHSPGEPAVPAGPGQQAGPAQPAWPAGPPQPVGPVEAASAGSAPVQVPPPPKRPSRPPWEMREEEFAGLADGRNGPPWQDAAPGDAERSEPDPAVVAGYVPSGPKTILTSALIDASGLAAVADARAGALVARAARLTGWPVARIGRRRPGPARAAGSADKGSGGSGSGRSSSGRGGSGSSGSGSSGFGSSGFGGGLAPQSEVDNAVTAFATGAGRGLPGPWPDSVVRAARSRADEIPPALAEAVRVPGPPCPVPLRWRLVAAVQWLLMTVAIASLLVAAAAGVVTTGTVRVPRGLPLGDGSLAPWLVALTAAGLAVVALAAGWLVSAGCRNLATAAADRERERAATAMSEQVTTITRDLVLVPSGREIAAYEHFRQQLSTARRPT